MAVIGKCDPPDACIGQLCSEPKDRGKNCYFRGLQHERGTAPVHSWPWEILGMFRPGCEKAGVIEKTFLIKSINLMGSQRHFAASCHLNSRLTRCCDPALHEGAAVAAALWVEGDTLQMGPSLSSQQLPKAKCLSQLGNGPWGLEALGTAHTQWMLQLLGCWLEESNIWQLPHAAKVLSELQSLWCRAEMDRNPPHDPNTFSLANLILLFLQ